MTSSIPPDPRHTQLRTWYDQLTARIAAADKDIGRSVYEHERQLHRERLAELTDDREIVTTYLDALERDQPLPGPWPPEFKTADLLAAPPPRILFKSGRCDFYRHIPLPPNYIPRPELLAEVRERLLAGTGGLALTSAIQVKQADMLHGMGGIGKSVLARALCDDPAVQAAFPDGILWATLGQTPDLTARLREWIETLGGIVGQAAPTLDQFRNTLAETLRDKACLLIVDDAWRKAYLEPFCAGGPACRLLITTRDAALAEGLDAGVYPIPVMAPDQAVALLEEWAQGGLAQVEAEVKAQIVKRLGCLPLAVRLAGAQLRQKNPTEWLASFDACKLKTRRVETVHDSLEATFALSLDALTPADRRLYAALAIFKEDEPTPVVAIARLWSALDGRDADETDELLDDLAARALLARSPANGNAITIHDLLRDFMAAELGEAGRIAAHRSLLYTYRATQRGDGWPTAPDDGYLYDHLAYHLDQLADYDPNAAAELRGLFAKQAWLHVRVPAFRYMYDGYVADLEMVWRRSHAEACSQINADQEPTALTDLTRYTLIRTGVNSLAASYPPALVARAVETGLLTPEKALSLARYVCDPEGRVAMTAALLRTGQLPPNLRDQAERAGLTAILAIEKEYRRAEALRTLAPELTGEALEGGLQAALAIECEVLRAEVLAILLPRLSGDLLKRATAAVLAIEDDWARPMILAALSQPFASEEQVLTGVVDHAAAPKIVDQMNRVMALRNLAARVTGAARVQALEAGLAAALTMEDGKARNRAIAILTPQLKEMANPILAVWMPASAFAAARREATAWASATRELDAELVIRKLGPAIVKQGLRLGFFYALVSLAPEITREMRAQALEAGLAAALAIESLSIRYVALSVLVPALRGKLLVRGLTAGWSVWDEPMWGVVWRSLVVNLTQPARNRLSRLRAAMTGRGREGQNEAWAPHSLGEGPERKLELVLSVGDKGERVRALAVLLSTTPNPEEILRTVRRSMVDLLGTPLSNRDQSDALLILCSHGLFVSPVLSAETVSSIVRNLIEICQEWEWL